MPDGRTQKNAHQKKMGATKKSQNQVNNGMMDQQKSDL